MADINLIPQAEKQEQVKEKAVKSSTIWTIIILLVVLGVGGYLYYQAADIKKRTVAHESNILGLRGDIVAMADIEVSARNLSQRYNTLREVLNNRNYNSLLLAEFNKRVPSIIELDTFGLGRENTINVSGIGVDYIAIAKFISDLSNQNFPEAEEGKAALFTDVSLNSVNLDSQTDKARFFIVITVNEALLKQ